VFEQILELETVGLERLARFLVDAEVHQVVGELGPQQELGGEVADGAAGLFEVGFRRAQPPYSMRSRTV